jgi:hypothetical protein
MDTKEITTNKMTKKQRKQMIALLEQVANPELITKVTNYDRPIEHYETRADGTIGGYVPVKKRKY